MGFGFYVGYLTNVPTNHLSAKSRFLAEKVFKKLGWDAVTSGEKLLQEQLEATYLSMINEPELLQDLNFIRVAWSDASLEGWAFRTDLGT